jgi:hypothetical protein
MKKFGSGIRNKHPGSATLAPSVPYRMHAGDGLLENCTCAIGVLDGGVAALVSPDAARPPGAPHRGVVVVQHVLLVSGAHCRLLLALQHLTVPAVLHVVLRLGEYQLPSLNISYRLEQSMQKKVNFCLVDKKI